MAEEVKSQNRRLAAKALHEKNSQIRKGEAETLKAQYLKEKANPVLVDILTKAKSFASYHTKMAQDGVGARATNDRYENGQPVMETVYYSNEKRISEIDKASGILELVDYIERQITEPKPSEEVVAAAEEAQTEAE
jgi:hypothetical protein